MGRLHNNPAGWRLCCSSRRSAASLRVYLQGQDDVRHAAHINGTRIQGLTCMFAFMHDLAHTAVHKLCTGYAACLHTVPALDVLDRIVRWRR